jgi:hypothetical protein
VPITYPVFVAEPRQRVSGMAAEIGSGEPKSEIERPADADNIGNPASG